MILLPGVVFAESFVMLCFILSIIILGICKVCDEFEAGALRVLVEEGGMDSQLSVRRARGLLLVYR